MSSSQRTHDKRIPPALTAVWQPFQTFGAAASLLLSPLSFGETRPQLSNLANLAPELIKEHRVKLYDAVNTAGGKSSSSANSTTITSPSSPSAKSRRRAPREKRKSSLPFHHPNDISQTHSEFSSTDTLSKDQEEDRHSQANSEVSLFTSFKATVACAEDEDAEGKCNRKKSGRKRRKLADLLFGPTASCASGGGKPTKGKWRALRESEY